MIGAIILAIFAAVLVAMMDRAFMGEKIFYKTKKDGDKVKERFDVSWLVKESDVTTEMWMIGLGTGLARLAVKYSGGYQILALVAMLVMIAAMLYVAWWWAGVGRSGKAFICFLLLQYIFAWVAGMAATKVIAMPWVNGSGILKGIVDVLPQVISLCAIGSAVVGWLERAGKKGWATVAIVLVMLLIASALWNGFSGVSLKSSNAAPANSGDVTESKDSKSESNSWIDQILVGNSPASNGTIGTKTTSAPAATAKPVATPQPTATPSSKVWYAFFNPSMLNDNDASNDYYFGFNCYDKSWTAKDYDKELRRRIEIDPALGAADIAWFDANVGTRYVGVFYDECNGAWDVAINKAKDSFIAGGQENYQKTIKAFFNFLDSAVNVEVRHQTSGIDDQMYMDPHTTSGVPDVMVMKADNHEGYFLVYTFNIKGRAVEVSYRIECGFQPCNVQKVMGITPKGSGGNGGNNNPPSPPSNPKDPTKGTDVGKNDTTGPGPDTNNGKGAQTSKADTPDSSSSMTYPEYKESVQEKVEVNENQRVGGDPNTPTVSAPNGTVVHSNADKGTGNGGIDTPTSVEDYVKTDGGVAVSGQTETHIEMPDQDV